MEASAKTAAEKRSTSETKDTAEPLTNLAQQPYFSHANVLSAGEKGLGLFASRDIKQSQNILVEPATLYCATEQEMHHLRGNGIAGHEMEQERLKAIIQLTLDAAQAHEKYFASSQGTVPSWQETATIVSRPIKPWLEHDVIKEMLAVSDLTSAEVQVATTLTTLAGGDPGIVSQDAEKMEIPFGDLDKIACDLAKIKRDTKQTVRHLGRVDKVQRFVADAHPTWELGDPEVSYMQRYSYLSSIVNHACIPNAMLVSGPIDETLIPNRDVGPFHKPGRPLQVPCKTPMHTKSSLIALRPIQKGEEITISYFPFTMGWMSHNREVRMHYLGRFFHFKCRCFECVDEDRQASIFWTTAPGYTKDLNVFDLDLVRSDFWKTAYEFIALSEVSGTAQLSLLLWLWWIANHHRDGFRAFLLMQNLVARLAFYLGRDHFYTRYARSRLPGILESSPAAQRYCASGDQRFYPDDLSMHYFDSVKAFFCLDASPDEKEYQLLYWDPTHGMRALSDKLIKRAENSKKKRQRQRQNAKDSNKSVEVDRDGNEQGAKKERPCDEQNLSKSQKRNRKRKTEEGEASESHVLLPLRPRRDASISTEPEAGSNAPSGESTTVEPSETSGIHGAEDPVKNQVPAASSPTKDTEASGRDGAISIEPGAGSGSHTGTSSSVGGSDSSDVRDAEDPIEDRISSASSPNEDREASCDIVENGSEAPTTA
jgi:hypothetical protein